MRLWSLHPKYLDRLGLVALWREGLLAQKVLYGKTEAYRNHPQLIRFKRHPFPKRAIAQYLVGIWQEAKKRNYNFNRKKIGSIRPTSKITVTDGQLKYEFGLLCDKLKRRSPEKYEKYMNISRVEGHPFFDVVKGKVADWERLI